MTWYIMAAEIPMGDGKGTQMVAVDAPTKREAINHAVVEVKREHGLPKSYTIMPRVLTEFDTREETEEFMKKIHDHFNEEEAKNAQA